MFFNMVVRKMANQSLPMGYRNAFRLIPSHNSHDKPSTLNGHTRSQLPKFGEVVSIIKTKYTTQITLLIKCTKNIKFSIESI